MRRRLCLVALAAGPGLVAARVVSHVPVMTRLVKLFLERESALLEAEASGDRATLEQLLSADFEQRAAASPGRPLARAQWLAALPAAGTASEHELALEQMAVHDLGDRALVSFLVRPASGMPRFLVDLWRREGDDWRLHVRYASPVN